MNLLTTSIPDMNVPIEEKRFANTTTKSVLVTRFFQKPFRLAVSSAISSKSFTFGFLMLASTMPANQPDASKGFKDVSGAMTKAVMTDRGWPRAHRTPKADSPPFHRIQDFSCWNPTSLLVMMV